MPNITVHNNSALDLTEDIPAALEAVIMMHAEDAHRMANSVDPDRIAPSG